MPEHIDTGERLRTHLQGYFAKAIDVTSDYETVFGEEHTGIGTRIPFYSDAAVDQWRGLIEQIHEFDFTKLDYEVIGLIFEGLNDPQRRRKYGQFYTRVELVDLMNSFCIRSGQERVMDPACGGGTFLVRTYARKRELNPAASHADLLGDLFGVDVAHFATHLTTINLATRDLIDEENYPQVARSDFFDIEPQGVLLTLPRHVETHGMGERQRRTVQVPKLDAVVANPPYIRQEQIPRSKRSRKRGPARGTKEYYEKVIRDEWQEAAPKLSGRSDVHCYFWPHAAAFLTKNGYLCFLTSTQWLDVDYGFRLQEWLLRHFRIVAIFESVAEPWFVGARVGTAATILQREGSEKARMGNLVRFVQLRSPLGRILAHDGTSAGAMEAADAFRDKILNLASNSVTDTYRVRIVRQADLWKRGVGLGVRMNKSKDPGSADPLAQDGKYYGGKWGVHVRAPDLWFGLIDDYSDRLAPLTDVAEVRRGVTTGNDHFFLVEDCTASCLHQEPNPIEFEAVYGAGRGAVARGQVKLVRCGAARQEIHPIESRFLTPIAHSIMEVSGFVLMREECRRHIVLIGEQRSALKGTYALAYIEWGERQGYHTKPTCAARASGSREWYDLTALNPAAVVWPKERQYRHLAPANPSRLIVNCRLYEIAPSDYSSDSALWGGVLNSSWTLLSSLQYGRPMGTEGNWSTMVADVNMMVVPSPVRATQAQRSRVSAAFRAMSGRPALCFLSERRLRRMTYLQRGKKAELAQLSDESELDMADRRELDDAVLELMGEESQERRDDLIDGLYDHLRRFFEGVRQKEERAIANKKRAKRRGPPPPAAIALEIYQEVKEQRPELLREYPRDFLPASKPFDTYELPSQGEARFFADMYIPHAVRFTKGKKEVARVDTRNAAQAQLLELLANDGIRGLVRVPRDSAPCAEVLTEYQEFARRRDHFLDEMVRRRTTDQDLQDKIWAALLPMVVHGKG